MTDWTWAKTLWHEHFDPVAGHEGELKLVDQPTYWSLFESKMRPSFPDEAFFDMQKLLGGADNLERRQKTASALAVPVHDFYCTLTIRNELAAMFCGRSHTPHAWRMWNSVVANKFQRQGIYAKIVEGHIGYSKALGFDTIRSEHAICNNAVLVAKLRRGFHISSFEMDPGYGPTIVLNYFHRPEQRQAYLFRCGMATMTPQMLASGNPAMQELAHKFKACP